VKGKTRTNKPTSITDLRGVKIWGGRKRFGGGGGISGGKWIDGMEKARESGGGKKWHVMTIAAIYQMKNGLHW